MVVTLDLDRGRLARLAKNPVFDDPTLLTACADAADPTKWALLDTEFQQLSVRPESELIGPQ